jgi:hypothetical protein
MDGHNHGGGGRQFVQVFGQPCELRSVDTCLPGAIFRCLNGIEDDEVVSLVVKGIVGFSNPPLVSALALHRVVQCQSAPLV